MMLLLLLAGIIPCILGAPLWVESAQQRDVAFAQVREDPLLDSTLVTIVNQMRPPGVPWQGRMLMVASGGDTAAWLVAHPLLKQLWIVDTNVAQLELTQEKLKLVTTCSPQTRQHVYNEPPLTTRYEGRYERVFAQLRKQIQTKEPVWYQEIQDAVDGILDSRYTFREGILANMTSIFCDVMSHTNLQALFGHAPTHQDRLTQPYCVHFAKHIHKRLGKSSEASRASPWAAQMFLGRFGTSVDSPKYPWLTLPSFSSNVTLWTRHDTIVNVLNHASENSYDIIQLSNVLDWMSLDEVQQAFEFAAKALAPGGAILLRQLNSNHDFPTLIRNLGLQYQASISKGFHEYDRSLFYKSIHVAFKSQRTPPSSSSTNSTLEWTSVNNNHKTCDILQTLAKRLLLDNEDPVVFQKFNPLKTKFLQELEAQTMPWTTFQRSQCRFREAVDQFARNMSPLLFRVPRQRDQMTLLDNIAEEWGGNDPSKSHPQTFRALLNQLKADCPRVDYGDAGVRSFNFALAGLAHVGEVDTAMGAFGMIELAFSHISSRVGSILERHNATVPWAHYNKHAWLDVDHANQFFASFDSFLQDETVSQQEVAKRYQNAVRGLYIGAQLFFQLFESIISN